MKFRLRKEYPREYDAPKVIIVEDNSDLCEELTFQLERLGMEVRTASHAAGLDALLPVFDARVLVLDVNLPDEDGFSIARRMYAPAERGIVMMTGSGGIEDRVRGIAGGADAYLVKPVDVRELAAMIRHINRRFAPSVSPGESGWSLDPIAQRLHAPDGESLPLSKDEVTVLLQLLEQPAAVFDRDDIVAHLGMDHRNYPDARLNALLCRLRQKLLNFHHSLRLHSWRSRGYAFVGPTVRVEAGLTGPSQATEACQSPQVCRG